MFNTIIIGGGHSGIVVLKRLIELNVDVILLEKKKIGNSWKHRNDYIAQNSCFFLYKSKKRLVCKPKNKDIVDYLNNYVEEFNLKTHIRENHEILSISHENIKKVYTNKGIFLTKNIINCSGSIPKKNNLIPVIKDNNESTFNIIGSGLTALELACKYSKKFKKINIIYRNKKPIYLHIPENLFVFIMILYSYMMNPIYTLYFFHPLKLYTLFLFTAVYTISINKIILLSSIIFLTHHKKIAKIKSSQLILLCNYKIIISPLKKNNNIFIKKQHPQSIYNNYIYAIGERTSFYDNNIIRIYSDLFFFGYNIVQKINNLHKNNFFQCN